MKRFLFFTIFTILTLCCNTLHLSAQVEWETLKTSYNIISSDTESPLDIQKNGDYFVLTNYNKRQKGGRWTCYYGKIDINSYNNDDTKMVKFDIGYNWSKGNEFLHDIKIRFLNTNLETEEIRYIYHYYSGSVLAAITFGADTSFCKSKIQRSKFSNNQWIQTYESDWNEVPWPLPITVEIQYHQNSMKVVGDTTYTQVRKIEDIYIGVGESTGLKISNFAIQRQTLYSKVKAFIENGDQYLIQENYKQAALEYTKAIDANYKNYDLYMKRAMALTGAEFYTSAIDDLTNAISYSPTPEAYLMRGKIKAIKQDPSCIEDLKKGGPEGEMILKEMAVESNSPQMEPQNISEYISTGSGIILSTNGIIVTNYHVIDGAKRIDVFISRNNELKKYNAKVLISDKQNDLSLLKIEDSSFTTLPTLPYAIKTTIQDVGTSVFALGYPMSNILGEELKVTDGIISSKTGYQGDIVTYQISAPIQPGNSGGPLFDKQGNLVGITNAGIPDAQNVGYAIKASYLRLLIDASPVSFSLPTNNTIYNLPFTEKIKRISPYVVLIKIK